MLIAALAALGVVAVTMSAHIQLPFSLHASGRTGMVREWYCARDRDGGYTAILLDHERETVQSLTITRFERGDAVEFRLHSAIIPGAAVGEGDTVGVIISHALEEELSRLRGQLSVVRASLAVSLTGEKASVVQEALNRVNHARIQADEQRRVVERQRMLWEKEYISQQDFEMFSTTLKLYEAEVAIAEARLDAATTGVKGEQLELIRAEITALEGEIAALECRRRHFTILSPFRGSVFCLAAGDTLVALGDNSTYLVTMPVRLRDLPRIDRNRDVIIRIRGLRASLLGRTRSIGNVVGIVQGEQIAAVTVIVGDGKNQLYPGQVVDCTIPCRSVNLRERVENLLTPLFAP